MKNSSMNARRGVLILFLCGALALASRPAPEPVNAAPPPGEVQSDTQVSGLCIGASRTIGEIGSDLQQNGGGFVTPAELELLRASQATVEPPDYEITLICAPFHCPPCESAKAHRVPWLREHGWTVNVCEADDDDNVQSFPTWIVTRHGVEVHRWSGHSWSAGGTDTFNRNLRIAKGEQLEQVSGTSSLADWIDSHYRAGQQLDWGVYGITAYDHLQDGSGGTHTWTRQQLAGLNEWQLLCLHDATHKGLIRARDW